MEEYFNEGTPFKYMKSQPDSAKPLLANRAFVTTEIVQKWPDGTEEVKYRRPYGSESAKELMQQVDERAYKSGYFYRHVC